MELEIKRAFRTPFCDDKWYIKLIFPLLVAFLAGAGDKNLHLPILWIVPIFLLMIPLSLALSGFYLQLEHNEIHTKQPLLPFLKDKWIDYLMLGLKSLALSITFFAFAVLLFIPLFILLKMENFLWTILGLLVIVCIIFIGLMLSFATSRLADTFDLKSAFEFNTVLSLMSKAVMEIFVYLLICVMFGIVLSVADSILKHTHAIFFIMPIITVFSQVITVDLKAQVYKVAKSRLENLEV